MPITYPPLIVQIGGNTAGATANIRSGTVLFAGGNNVTLSQNLNSITISAGAGGGGAGTQTFGMSNLGNTSGTSGVITGPALQMILVGGNNVTLSQSINGSSATITISGISALQTHNSAFHSGTIFPQDVNQAMGSAFLDIGEIADPGAPSASNIRLFNFNRFGRNVLRFRNQLGFALQLAQDNVIVVRNETGTTIPAFSAVYESGTGGSGEPLVALAQANSSTTMPALGVTMESIANNANGFVMMTGVIQDVNTTGFSVGDILYVSSTVAGGLTTTPPVHPNMRQRMVRILTSAANGSGVVTSRQPKGNTDDIGTPVNIWQVGDGAAGAKSVGFSNANQAHLAWNPSANRTVFIPDASGTLALGTAATTVSAVASDNVVGTNTSRFALEDHQHLGVFSAGVSNLGNTVGDTGVRPGRWVLQGGNNITLSQVTAAASLQTIVISGPNTAAQSAESNTFGISNLGNTSGTSGVISGPQVRLLFAGGNNVTLSQSINGSSATITISAFTQTVQTQGFSNTLGASNLGNTSGTSGVVSGTGLQLVFAGGNNITLSQSINGSSATITISGAAGGGAGYTAGMSNIGNTSGTSGLVTGQLVFAGGNNITLSQSVNGGSATLTISAGAGGGAFTYDLFAPFDEAPQVIGSQGQGTLHFQPVLFPNVQFDRVGLRVNFSNATNSTGTITLSMWMGIYTRNATGTASISLLMSTSNTIVITHSGTVRNSLQIGPRLMTIGWTTTITNDEYFVGVISRTTSGGANATFGQYLASQINSNYSGILGASSAASVQRRLGQGVYSATTSSLPNTVAFSQINGTLSLVHRPPTYFFLSMTA